MMTGASSYRRKLEPLCAKIGRPRVDQVVHAFYTKLRTDPVLHGYFDGITDFSEHEALIADFWWVAMGGILAQPRQFDMLGRHRTLGLTPVVFERWLALFGDTMAIYLPPDLATQWLQMAVGIGANLQNQMPK